MLPTDAQLLHRTRAAEPEAFAEVIDRHKDRMINYLTRLTGCRDRAEELAQETFVRLYQHLERYREQGELAAYLFRIATNLVRSEERRKRRFRLLEPLVRTNGHHPAPSPRAEALSSEAQQQVSQALASLALPYRAPLVLREIEGLSYRQIATALGCREGTIKSRIHRGKQLLKEKLAPYWKGEV